MSPPRLHTSNPATSEPGRSYDGHTPEQARGIVADVRAAFTHWRATAFAERARLMRAAASVLRARRDELAALMTAEMGKPVKDGREEVEKCAFNCEHFAEHGAAFLADEPVDLGPDGPRAFVTFQPLGVVLAVMPWNFPLWQVFRFAAPTLMAGNTAVLKHASNVPGCALAIEAVFKEAGFSADVFRTVLVGGSEVAALIGDDDIAAVTLTGSVAAGRAVVEAAGRALKKCVLELGGSDAYLIRADADLAQAAEIAATARMVNGGQSCIAGKRFIVVGDAARRAAFAEALAAAMQAWTPADPTLDDTRLGPLVGVAARDEVHGQVERSVAAGARLVCGGEVPERAGAWYPPTVLDEVAPGQPAHDEEVFGPVAAVIGAADEAAALATANGSSFGLGGGVLTADAAAGERLARDAVEAGMVFVNGAVRSDPRLPFGGVKHSGYGREVSRYGILEFVNVKTVVVAG